MFSKRYYRYTIIALFLIVWLVLIEFRIRDNPVVRHVTVESEGLHHLVCCEIWNPREEEVRVIAIIRLVHPGSPGGGVGVTSSTAGVVKGRIGPRDKIVVQEHFKTYGTWRDADVRVFVVTDPEEIEELAAHESSSESHSR